MIKTETLKTSLERVNALLPQLTTHLTDEERRGMWRQIVRHCTTEAHLNAISDPLFQERAADAFLKLHLTETPKEDTSTKELVRLLSGSLKGLICRLIESKKIHPSMVKTAPDDFDDQLRSFFSRLKQVLIGQAPKESLREDFFSLLGYVVYWSHLDACPPPRLTEKILEAHTGRFSTDYWNDPSRDIKSNNSSRSSNSSSPKSSGGSGSSSSKSSDSMDSSSSIKTASTASKPPSGFTR